jgi:sigma-B regulation protein RsbU (phosphoserine phosphatase)
LVTSEKQRLLNRIEELEQDLAECERDLDKYRNELVLANTRMKKLIVQMSQDLKVVSAIQKVLVPTEFPNIPGFEFSTKFIASPIQGGDYFDIFEHHDRFRFGLVLASSSGYGMSALLLSILLKLGGELEARRGRSSADAVEALRKELWESMTEQDRAQIFYAVIDRRSFEMGFTHLGRMAAVHFSHSRQEFVRLESQGPAISLDHRQGIPESVVALNARDRVIIVSEGLFHIRNINDEEYGEERFFDSLMKVKNKGVHEVRNEILFKLEKFHQGVRLSRDLTVIVLEVKDRVIKLAQD